MMATSVLLKNVLCVVIICALQKTTIQHPLSINEYKKECSFFNSKVNYTHKVLDKVWTVRSRGVRINYNLCGGLTSFTLGCKSPTVCLENKSLGHQFVIDEDNILDKTGLILKSIGGDRCTASKYYSVIVNFECSDSSKESPRLILGEDDCDFEIRMMHPGCTPKCTANINGVLIDLRNLKQNIPITNGNKNKHFRLTLCGTNPECDAGVSSCEIIGNRSVSLLSTEFQHVHYNFEKQQLSVRGKYKVTNRITRNVEVIIKCNWNADIPTNAVYKEPQIQGKRYLFEIESSYACIKLPFNCMAIQDPYFTYNIRKLFNAKGYWTVSNLPPTTKQMLINICGPLTLSNGFVHQLSDNYSQVFEITRNNDNVNRGSIPTDLRVVDKVLELTLTDGSPCGRSSYSTNIQFECTRYEEGPSFNKLENCVTHLKWKTPQACPAQDENRCAHETLANVDCVYDFDGFSYNLNPLKNRNGVLVRDVGDGVEYFLNVCQAVTIKEAPCMKYGMVMVRKPNEPNIANKYYSIGNVDNKFSVVNNKLTLRTMGYYCDDGNHYENTIHFECNPNVEAVTLLKKSKCAYEFLWKTKHACPKVSRQCNFLLNTTMLNINKFKYPKLNIESQEMFYSFDMCSLNYTVCFNKTENCNNYIANRTMGVTKETPYIELRLNDTCTGLGQFNKARFEYICDLIADNEHYLEQKPVNNCVLTFQYKTNQVCALRFNSTVNDTQNRLTQQKTRKVNHENETLEKTTSAPNLIRKKRNCTVTNHNTGKQLDVSDFAPSRIRYSGDCPNQIVFNVVNKTVKLTYFTKLNCDTSKPIDYYYDIVLRCSQEIQPLTSLNEQEKCVEHLQYSHPDVCSLLAPTILEDKQSSSSAFSNSESLVLASVTSMSLLVAVLGLGFIFRKKFAVCLQRRRRNYLNVYDKDGNE